MDGMAEIKKKISVLFCQSLGSRNPSAGAVALREYTTKEGEFEAARSLPRSGRDTVRVRRNFESPAMAAKVYSNTRGEAAAARALARVPSATPSADAGRPAGPVVARTCDAAAARMHDWSGRAAGESAIAMPAFGAVPRDEADACVRCAAAYVVNCCCGLAKLPVISVHRSPVAEVAAARRAVGEE